MTKLPRLTATILIAALPLAWIRAADTPPVVIESAPETDVSKLQQEIAALRADNQRLTGELRDAQWALGEAKTRIDELSAPKPAPKPAPQMSPPRKHGPTKRTPASRRWWRVLKK